jgi:tetraacyldisaccharide 4'-kinase
MIRKLLRPFTIITRIILWLRNFSYAMKFLPVFRPMVPVISVGSMYAQGAGRTPLIEYLLLYFQRLGMRSCVISCPKGFVAKGTNVISDGRTVSGNALLGGDELYQIARKFPQTSVVAGSSFKTAVDFAIKFMQPEVIILDDAFHHLTISRKLDIVVVDSRVDITKVPLAPAGGRREPLSALKRAQIIVYNHMPARSQSLPTSLKKYASSPGIGTRYIPKKFRAITGKDEFPVESFQGRSAILFCGIASPQMFRTLVATETGVQVAHFLVYANHHVYSGTELASINRHFDLRKADLILTTEKDAVRLLPLVKTEKFPWESCYYLEIEMSVVFGEGVLYYALQEKFGKKQ